MDMKAFEKYLATGEKPAAQAQDAAPKGWKPDNKKYVANMLEMHDRRFHPNGYKEGDFCKLRETLAKGDKSDADLAKAEKEEKKPSNGAYNPTDAEIEEAAKATSKAFHFSKQGVKNKILDMLKGTRVYADQDGDLLTVVMAMKGKGSVVQAIKAHAKEQFIREDHPWFDRKYWEEYDAELALRNKLAKGIESDYKKHDIAKKTGQTVEAFVSQFIDDAKADGFTVSEKSADLLRKRLDNLIKMPASAPYEPRFDMDKQSLYGYGKEDPEAMEAANLAADFNKDAGWGFSDDEVQAYIDAFKDMDAGKFPYGLPEFEGKVNEKNFNEGDFSKEDKKFRDLLKVLASRPDLIRPYIVERLEDANFHAEVKELRSGAYKNRTKPYNSMEEYRKRKGSVTFDAADRYLAEVAKDNGK